MKRSAQRQYGVRSRLSRKVALRFPCWLALCLLAPAVAHAAEVRGVQVTRDGQSYLIGMQIAIDAAPPEVFRALQDYAAMPRYNPDLTAVRVQATADSGSVRLSTTVHTCVLFFCRTMHQDELMRATESASGGTLEAELMPQAGAFRGNGRWTVDPCPAGRLPACLDAQIRLVPQFWVPPVIGPWLLRRKMYEEAQRTSAGLEQVARGRLPPSETAPRR